MNLRSQHILTKTDKGQHAWRSQAMPGLHRKLLATLRAPMSVQDMLGRLTNFEMTEMTEGIIDLATKGWITVEDPPRLTLVEGEEGGEPGEQAPDEALSDLIARRPLPMDEEVAPEESLPVPPHLSVVQRPVAETEVFARGTEQQEQALLIAMGLAPAPKVSTNGLNVEKAERNPPGQQ